jgi:hypothetical protein
MIVIGDGIMSDFDVNIAEKLLHDIKDILDKNGTVAQTIKDNLILTALGVVVTYLGGFNRRLTHLEKYRPYLQALTWGLGVIGGLTLILIWKIVTGEVQIIFGA